MPNAVIAKYVGYTSLPSLKFSLSLEWLNFFIVKSVFCRRLTSLKAYQGTERQNFAITGHYCRSLSSLLTFYELTGCSHLCSSHLCSSKSLQTLVVHNDDMCLFSTKHCHSLPSFWTFAYFEKVGLSRSSLKILAWCRFQTFQLQASLVSLHGGLHRVA